MSTKTSVTSRLEGEQMVVAYGEHTVLNGVDFQVPEGELTVMLPQTPEAPSGVTVADVVARGRYPHQSLLRSWSEEDERACVEAMKAANVLELAERPIEALSGGQRQRVWIAMTLAQQTPLILLDEPTTYLDITHQIEVLNLTKKLHAEGRTVAVVLHDLNLAFRYATHVVLMKQGRIIAQGDPRAIITPELIQEVFDLQSIIIPDPCTGTPLVIPKEHQDIRIYTGGKAGHCALQLARGSEGPRIPRA